MKHYVPKLIPDSHRVLPDYFMQPDTTKSNTTESLSNLLWNAFSAVVILIAVVVIGTHTGFGLSLLALAFFASGWGKQRIERGLQFHFTPYIKAGVLGILSLTSMFTGYQYRERVDQAAEQVRLAVVAEQKAAAELKQRRAIRIDSLRTYLAQADTYLKKGAYTKAVNIYAQSARFATTDDPEEQRRLHSGMAVGYVRTKQYKEALREYDNLATTSSLDGDQSYQRALCYQHEGRKTEALIELQKASEAGHRPAAKLYEKLNPVIRKLLYYQTVCCDGSDSPSNAKGRGACSHHGGVCNWNKPIYDTHRKYDANGL